MSNKISIVVATYNAAKTLPTMIESVVRNKQNFPIELIIVDGGSKDETINVINSYKDHITCWISEPDKGIYDAWNKGIKLSTGNWVMFLGADDLLADNAITTYQTFINKKAKKDTEYISSKVQMIDKLHQPIWVNGEKWIWPKFRYKMMVAHPGSLHSKKLFDKYGLYNIKYKITGDYELLLRPQEKLKAEFIDEITVNMTEGGISDSWAGIKDYMAVTINTGKGNKIRVLITGLYIFIKANINTIGRNIGLNLNKKR